MQVDAAVVGAEPPGPPSGPMKAWSCIPTS